MIALGSYVFNATYHSPMPVQLAPKQEVRFQVFGLDGVAKVIGGRTSRIIPIQCGYCNYFTETSLYAALDVDDSQKGGTAATLLVGDAFATNCHLLGIDVQNGPDGRPAFRDGALGLWNALNVTLVFEQLVA